LQLIEIQAIGITTSKQLGEAAKAAFLSKASGLGFAVCRWAVLISALEKSSEKVLDTDIA